MYKLSLLVLLIITLTLNASERMGANLVNNSPLGYLLDLIKFANDIWVTKTIGNKLLSSNALNQLSTYDHIIADFDQKPITPSSGSSFTAGQWIWIPDSIGAETGTWYWILKPYSYYLMMMTPAS